MTSVQEWSGLEARALRRALRMTLREFAARLGVGERTVSKWEALGAAIVPRQVMQAALDTKLRAADEEVHTRFRQFLAASPRGGSTRFSPVREKAIDYEWWADDLDRSLVFLNRQEFDNAKLHIDRWMRRFVPSSVNTRGMHLYGRSLRLLGDIQADQGVISGPDSAQENYLKALAVFEDLKMPRRTSQIELQLTVLDEMSGKLEVAAKRYRILATDERLDQCDRTRAQLWIGTALSKLKHNEVAVKHILSAIRAFEALGEPDDWSVAHQKLALARRGTGDLKGAYRSLDVAMANQRSDAPMQRVRLSTAHAHILLSDHATSNEGLAILGETARLSAQYGLRHQLQSIESIRTRFEREQCL